MNVTQRDDKEYVEGRYYILSKFLAAKKFAAAVRGHWGIGNRLYWQLDVTFLFLLQRVRECRRPSCKCETIIFTTFKICFQRPVGHLVFVATLRIGERFVRSICTAQQWAIEIDPNNAAAHNHLGVFLHRQGLIDEDIFRYRVAIRSAPQNAEAIHNLTKAYDERNQIDEAEELYRKAINLAPNNSQFHNSLGVFLIVRKSHLNEAIACFREAVRLDPRNQLAQDNLRHAINQSR